ncbi:hypothetical protein QJS04_geneDACA013378 [Acorus gramineus]|uniref:Pre-rRNA-processing protein RIX1 N-terminal domain-containing protein n=1 Tax=Acorus gramineus TaxID=55184 RepID=A0AAV9AA97_ACOGR|nr:hypothetical protein QJS04_geneDACA013378 [Acorus gramineus]
MAGSDLFANMNDHRLKPRLLRSIVRDRLPEENRPFPAPSELSHIVSSIKNHGLLSESVHGPVDPKTMEGWKSAMDEWVDRLVSLVSGDMPDKCWAGICLLGLTCQECSSDRFQASHPVWFQKLLSKIQPPSDSHFVKVSSCAALSDLFTRLFGFPNVKKDATSLSGKAVHPVLQLLSDDSVEVVEGAIDLLCTLVTLFPSSMHRHFDTAETAIVSKFMSGRCSMKMSEKFAKCMALLPKARGDNESWSLLMQRILISINVHLNESFELFEEETRHTEAMRFLVPSGKDPPPPLGGQSLSDETSDEGIKRFRQLLVPRISVLMQCCCAMLANSYPVQVTVPTRALLALVWRVLSVDGSLHASMSPFITSLHQELICSELPILHLETLDLLTAIIKGARRQLLPHAAGVARLLMEYFTRAALPDLRIKIYSIMRILLTSMGVGLDLEQEWHYTLLSL